MFRIDRAALKPHIEALFGGLFSVLKQRDSTENEYVMKGTLKRVVWYFEEGGVVL